MKKYWVHALNHPGRELSEQTPLLTIGRSSANDVVLDDPSISRSHARLRWEKDQAFLEDLGSRNGSMVNGRPVSAPCLAQPGDAILLGAVSLVLSGQPQLALVRVEDAAEAPGQVSMIMSVDQLRNLRSGSEQGLAQQRWRDALAIVHEMSLELLGDQPVQAMLEKLLEQLFVFLKPSRGAVLLKVDGRLEQVYVRSGAGRDASIRLSRTMVEAAVERREAMLVKNAMHDERLAHAASMVQSGTTSIMTVPLAHEGEVVGLVYLDAGPQRQAFTEEDLTFVAAMSRLAAAKIEQVRMAEEVHKKRDLDKEMAVARQIQERLLPSGVPELDGYELFGINVSCKQVSGDLYGFWPRPDGKLWIVIADVAGKGVGPGLLMATFQAYMGAWSETGMDSAELAGKISTTLGRSTTPNRFITAFLSLLDPATGEVESTNAGHNPILLLRADGRRELLESQGFPLAMFPGGPYGRARHTLEPGDLLVLYTDGISEAADAQGNEFELRGLEEVMGSHPHLPLPGLHHLLQAALDRHTAGAPMNDDRTLVMLRRSR